METLPHVTMKKIPYMNGMGEIISLPGPWAIETDSSPVTPATPATMNRRRLDLADDVDDADDVESVSSADESDHPSRLPTVDRFVVRNEFGHVRIQPLIDALEHLQEHGRTMRSLDVFKVGGHCVLPPDIFQACLEAGKGEKHPFAGRFHPIAGNVIPETTLLFYGPRSEEELEDVWSIVLASYDWVRATCQSTTSSI